MEAKGEKHTQAGRKAERHWNAFKVLIALFGPVLRLLGLHERGLRNALDVRFTRLELGFDNLPPQFDGFRILELSDLHLDFLPGPLETALELAAGERIDLCVSTGDYRKRASGHFEHILPVFEKLPTYLSARHGISRSSVITIAPEWWTASSAWASAC